MGGKYGVKDSKEFVVFFAALGEAIEKSASDGKIGFEDVVHLMDPLMKSSAAFSDAALALKELGELDEQDKAELLASLKSELDLEDDKIELVVEKSLEAAVCVMEVVAILKK